MMWRAFSFFFSFLYWEALVGLSLYSFLALLLLYHITALFRVEVKHKNSLARH